MTKYRRIVVKLPTCRHNFYKIGTAKKQPFKGCFFALRRRALPAPIFDMILTGRLHKLDNGLFCTVAATFAEKVDAGVAAALTDFLFALSVLGSDLVEELFH